MRWMKRGLWTAAWGCWVWLGFGLHRELPRELGPERGKLKFEGLEEAYGFLADEAVVVSNRFGVDGGSHSYRLWDVESGKLKLDRRIDLIGNGTFKIEEHPSLGFVVGVPSTSDEGKAPDAPLQSIDIRTGERRVLCSSQRSVFSGCFHDRETWMVALHDLGEVERLEVYDLRTGKIFFEWAPVDHKADCRIRIHNLRWIPGTNSLYIAYWVIQEGPKPTKSTLIEVWNVVGKVRIARHAISGIFLHTSGPAAGGRVMLGQSEGRPRDIMVLDAFSGSVVLSNREDRDVFNDSDVLQSDSARAWILSENGRCMISSGVAWNIDRNRVIWSAVNGLESVVHDPSMTTFLVAEQWSLWFLDRGWSWLPSTFPNTWAVRDLETGSVLYRVYGGHPRTGSMNSDGSLSVHPDGTIYGLPPRPNYPLLAICQTILAMPLVLLWAILRWRRRRRLRLAGGAGMRWVKALQWPLAALGFLAIIMWLSASANPSGRSSIALSNALSECGCPPQDGSGFVVPAKGPILVGGRKVRCPMTASHFAWVGVTGNGEQLIVTRRGGRGYRVYARSAEPTHVGMRVCAVIPDEHDSDHTIMYLRDDQVDWDTNSVILEKYVGG